MSRSVTPFAPFDARPKIEHRDTDPSELAPEAADTATATPLESLYSLKAVSEKLDKVLAAAVASTNESIATRVEVRALAETLQSLAKRVTALEVSGRWAPLIISSISIVGVLWMAFALQRMQLQLQTLLH